MTTPRFPRAIREWGSPGHPGLGFPVHHLVAEAGGVICENLTNLEAIGDDEAWISLLPIALARADGAPVRAVAVRFAM